MLKNFLPRNDNFFVYFEKLAALIVKGAHQLLLLGHPTEGSEEAFEQIKLIEQEGDQITHHCVEALHKTFITPFERSDIHHLISKMDDILDEIEDVGCYFVLYKLNSLPDEARQLVELVIKSAKEMEEAIKELRKMKNTQKMRKHFSNINQFESAADLILIQALSRLFEEEQDARTLIKWKEVYEHLEYATDICEDVANILEGIILENE